MPTYTPKPDEVTRSWHLIDAEGKVLGRLAVEIANLLRGKHKPTFTYNTDVGDHVVVINADKIVVTAAKAEQKRYYRHSGYPGGLRTSTFADEMAKSPEEVLRRAVRGMLPKNRLSRQVIKKLKIYVGPEHPHEAQFRGTPGVPNSNTKRREAKERRKAQSAKKRPATKAAAAPEPADDVAVEAEAELVATAAVPAPDVADEAGTDEPGTDESGTDESGTDEAGAENKTDSSESEDE